MSPSQSAMWITWHAESDDEFAFSSTFERRCLAIKPRVVYVTQKNFISGSILTLTVNLQHFLEAINRPTASSVGPYNATFASKNLFFYIEKDG